MSFDRRDIRKAMDVYTVDNAYVGTVLAIVPGMVRAEQQTTPAADQISKVNGELLGPAPTEVIGNRAPTLQGAAANYAVAGDAEVIGDGAIEVGRWWGLRGRRTIPLADVQTVSLERVVIGRRSDELR